MKNIIAKILLISTLLTAQTGDWSPPVQLSRDGVGPYLFMGVPVITVDSSGTIHAFWVVSPSDDGSVTNRYSQIEYRRSADGGKTWSATENLTLEYTTQRIYYMKAVCDSKNNVHLVYMRGSEALKVMYKMFDGDTWTEPVQIGSGSVYLQVAIDSDDRVYALWMVGHYVYYTFLESSDVNSEWIIPQIMTDSEFGIDFLTVDNSNNLCGTGSAILWDTYYTYRPYLFKYSKLSESWVTIEEIGKYDEKCLAGAIAVSKNDSIYSNVAVGQGVDINTDNHLSKFYDDPEWSKPYTYGENNDWDRELYIDRNDYLHLFELHFYVSGNTNEDMGLVHSIGKNGRWETTVIDSSDENYSYSEPNVAFDKINNKFYLLYNQSDKINSTNRIYFRSKKNTTGIENSDDIIVKGYELYQNYPNPFNNSTNISYLISQPAVVKLSVFNSKGEFIQNLVNTRQNKGHHSVVFKADNLNSGIYYYRIAADGVVQDTRKMLYLK